MLVSCRPTDSGIVIADITPTEYGARLHVLKIVLSSVLYYLYYRNYLIFGPNIR